MKKARSCCSIPNPNPSGTLCPGTFMLPIYHIFSATVGHFYFPCCSLSPFATICWNCALRARAWRSEI